MSDPFFDEDDGEFDDLYENPRPSATSPSVRPKPRDKDLPAASPETPGDRISTRSPDASSSVVSRSYARDRTGSSASNATDLGKPEKARKKRGKPRRKASQELFEVTWESDVKVAKCGLCSSDFSLVKRKHHCRHCGRVMCSDCSCFLYFEFSHRKHRVCASCNQQLLTEQEAYDREALAGTSQGRSSTADLFDSSDGRPSVAVTLAASTSGEEQDNLRTPKRNDEERARKKQEKKERKKTEKLKKQQEMVSVVNTGEFSRGQADKAETVKEETALFDGAGDDWFTDVPDRNARSRDSGDEYSEAGSKGPGWRDRVKDTYTISEQPSVFPPMTGSTLTAGITGKGYISDQFRYDVGGPALGHEDDLSVVMPRPKQQSATTTYTDSSIKPSRLTGNGYFSEQFQYDVGGPGLGHDDDHLIGMPRPKQQPVAAPYSYDHVDLSRKLSEVNTSEYDFGSSDFQPRLTLKDNLKDMFGTKRRESSAKTKEKDAKARKPRARGNENMTLDELNPSYSSEDEPRMGASAMPRPTVTSVQPIFYENDADKVVVDDAPGFFEATIAERESQRKKEEDQQKQLARDMAWVSSSALPPSVSTHRFSSEQDSYSIVDHPSHTSNSPVQNQRVSSVGATPTGSSGNSKGGFTKALKRFFGMGSKTAQKATTPPKSTKRSTPATEKIGAENHPVSVPKNTHHDSGVPTEPASSGLARHTVVNYYETSRQDIPPQESFRNTVGVYADLKDADSRFEATAPSQVDGTRQRTEQNPQKSERKRRDTFDDLFESPKNNEAASETSRYSSAGATEWAVRGGGNPDPERKSYGASAVGVARFDQRRSIGEADEFTLGGEPKASTGLSDNSTDAWRRSAAMSLLDDRKEATQSEGAAFTWRNVRSAPGLGTATYAVPTSLQPHAVYNGDRFSSGQLDTPSAPLGSIMDDLKRGSSFKKSPAKESFDDFFAEFEEPNDYVFDPATGGYVTSRAPVRAAVPRPLVQSVPTELESPLTVSEKAAPRSNGRDYYALSETVERVTTVAVIEKEGEEDGDEVADIIVDKISSLEGELAVLKQLIRSRNGSGGKNIQGGKLRENHTTARRSVRRESIFDSDSSDEDSAKPSNPYASTIQPAVKRAGNRRPGSKKKSIKKRKDSFADLFEDSPNEKETFGGATSYEALFQTGAKTAEGSKEEDSDDEVGPTVKPVKSSTTKSRRRSSRKKIDPVSPKEDSSESEFASLKGRRGKSLRRKNDDDTGMFDSSTKSTYQLVTKPAVDVVPALKPVQGQAEEDDPIDALFDTSNDRDVAKLLYGEDDARDEEDKDVVVEPQSDVLLNGSSAQASSTSLSDDGTSEPSITVATSGQLVARVGSPAYALDSQALVKADEDEEFSVNWTKMQKTKSQRHKSRRNPSESKVSADESIPVDDSTQSLPLDSSLLGAEHQESKPTIVEGVTDPVAAPSTFLADTSSNWMSISTLEDETVNLSFTGDKGLDLESLLQPVDENKSLELTVGSTFSDDNKGDENQKAAQSPVSMHQVSELAASASANDNLGERDDDTNDYQVLSNRSPVNRHSDSPKTDYPSVSEAAFDIFDESSDVNFLSATPPLDLKPHIYADDSDDDDRPSLLGEEEAFSFEIKVPNKRVSGIDATANISTTKSEPERAESSPPSPTPSVDETVELGKYTSSSVPSSVDGSVDDPEDAPLDDECVLGKVESQAFDSDWHQMQAKEKERKKRLQAKQRQAQRDKVLRKQGASSRSLTGGSTKDSSSKSKSKTGKKKKKDKDDTSSSSHHKKSGSSRKHRHREGDGTTSSQPPRSLTEL